MSGLYTGLSPEAVDSGVADRGTAKRTHILLVEGDGFTRLVLLLRLRLAGFRVDFTSNGILGLAKLRSCRPDVLLVELKLCGISGLQLIRAARAEATFGNRPIYVFTHANRMHRATTKEVGILATKLYDKNTVTREELVQSLVATFSVEVERRPGAASANGRIPAEKIREMVPPGVIEEIIAGVREQSELLAKCRDLEERAAGGEELLSRVCSLADCAEAAALQNLSRQARALHKFLDGLGRTKPGYTDAALATVATAVELMGQACFASTGVERGQTPSNAVIIDEAPDSNQALKEALGEAGFETAAFQDPAVAREHLASHRTDLIIANVLLPEAHGLALADIRELPLHKETPVLFVPESSVTAPLGAGLPGSAPHLASDTLTLAELVIKALNEVLGRLGRNRETDSAPAIRRDGTNELKTMDQYAREKNPAGASRPLVPDPAFSTPASLPAEDGFEIFAKLAGREQANAPDPGGQSAGLAVEQIERPLEGQAPQVPMQMEPDTAGSDDIAKLLTTLPVSSKDESQLDERPIRMIPPPDTLLEMQQAPELEQALDEPTSPPAWIAAAANETGQTGFTEAQTPELERNEPAVLESAPAATTDNEEVMNEQLEAAPAEFTAQAESNQPSEALSEHQKTLARCAELEQEVASLRQVFEHFNGSFMQEQPVTAEGDRQAERAEQRGDPKPTGEESGLPASEVEHQVRQGVAALARATAELAQERGERQRSEQRVADLSERLQALHEDLRRTLQAQRQDLGRIGNLEEQLRTIQQTLEQRTADLEQEQAERSLADEQLQKAKELNTQLRKDLSFYEGTNKRFGGARQELQTRLEASLNAARESEARLQKEAAERQRLAEGLESAQREVQTQSRRREALEQELQTTRNLLQDSEARLQKEIAERQRLSAALGSAQTEASDGSEKDLELSKLQSALEFEQVERQRQETLLARLRHNARDAAQAARALRTSLRRQIRGPVDNLVHSAQSLLELEMGEPQKKLAESVLQDVLLVQTRLREPEPTHVDSAEPAAPSTSTTT